MTPPPPPPGAHVGLPPPMPPQLQAMMRQMQQRQPKFQQQVQPPAPYQPHQGSRGRGRHGRGRGGFQQQTHRRNHRQNRGYNQYQFNRKRGPSDDVRDASRFFLPSFLEDPWKALKGGNGHDREQEIAKNTKDGGVSHWREEMRPQQARHSAAKDGLGRVLFQPSFLADPWVCLYN